MVSSIAEDLCVVQWYAHHCMLYRCIYWNGIGSTSEFLNHFIGYVFLFQAEKVIGYFLSINRDVVRFKEKIMAAGANDGQAQRAYDAVNVWCQYHV